MASANQPTNPSPNPNLLPSQLRSVLQQRHLLLLPQQAAPTTQRPQAAAAIQPRPIPPVPLQPPSHPPQATRPVQQTSTNGRWQPRSVPGSAFSPSSCCSVSWPPSAGAGDGGIGMSFRGRMVMKQRSRSTMSLGIALMAMAQAMCNGLAMSRTDLYILLRRRRRIMSRSMWCRAI